MISLSDHFTYRKLFRFTLPSVVMMLFTSVYGVVDGIFVSNYAGETAFASINLIFPFCMLFSSFGSMLGIGGSALVAMTKGKGEEGHANRIFSMLVGSLILIGAVFAVLGELLLPLAIKLFGATEEMVEPCTVYARIFFLTLPAFLLQYGFQSYLITAERPQLGLLFTVAAGVTNMILDWLFVGVMQWEVAGAAAATCIGQCVGGIGPLLFFLFSRTTPLKLVRSRFMPKEFRKAVSNGTADFVTTIALSLVAILFNWQLMRYIGEYGVSAYGIIQYVNFLFVAMYLGYSMGVAPVISYHHGAESFEELHGLYKKSLRILSAVSVVLTAVAFLTARLIAAVFAGYDEIFLELSTRALRLYSLSYLFAGVTIFGSNLYAALNNGLISGVLSGLRLFVFQVLAVFLLPLALGTDGIWLSALVAELLVFILTHIVFRRQKARYRY